MKTRTKPKADTNPQGLPQDFTTSMDFADSSINPSRSFDERADDNIYGPGNTKIGRNGASRASGRAPKAEDTRSRREKQLIESVEFQDVVKGFVKFIEELNRRKKKPSDKKAKGPDGKANKLPEEPDTRKKLKPETELSQALLNEKFEPQNEIVTVEAPKREKSEPYKRPPPQQPSKAPRPTEDINPRKTDDFAKGQPEKDKISKPARSDASLQEQQDQRGQYLPKDVQVNEPGYPGGRMDLNPYDTNLKYLMNANRREFNNPLMTEQQQKQAPNLGYDYNNVLQDMMQRIQLQSAGYPNLLEGRHMQQPYDNYAKMGLGGFGGDITNELMNFHLLQSLLQKHQPNLLGSLLGSMPGAASLYGNLSQELSSMTQNPAPVNQSYGNQSLGIDLSDPKAISPITFAKKLGRPATHASIAYSIYFKSMDPETIAQGDMSNMDPTYNARVMKERKYKGFVSDNSMIGRLMTSGLQNRMPGGLPTANELPLEYMGAQNLQDLVATQGMSQEAQLQRLQQEALLRQQQELSQAAALRQGGGDDRRNVMGNRLETQAEGKRSNVKQAQTKGQDVIEIRDDSDAETKDNLEANLEAKGERSDKKEKDSSVIEGQN